MLAYLNAVVAARAIDQERIVDIDGDVMNLQIPLAFSRAAASVIGTVAYAAGGVLPCEEDDVARLKLTGVSEQYAHFKALLRHRCGV